MVVVKTAGVATGFEVFPDGKYRATLQKYSERQSKSDPKAKSFKTEWLITEPEEFSGRKAFINGSLKEEFLWSIKRIGVALGVEDSILEDPQGWDPEEVLPEFYNEQEVDLIITAGEPYNGKATNNVDVILEGEKAADKAEGGSWS